MSRSVECLGHFRIQVYHELLLRGPLLIPLFKLPVDPASKLLPNDRVDHVEQPLPWEAGNVFAVGEVVHDLRVLCRLFEKVGHCDRLVHGRIDVPNIFCRYV